MNDSKKVLKDYQNGALVGSETQRPEKELVILRGITTSQINQALKAKNPYPARVFLKIEGFKEDIPVFFRLIDLEEPLEFKPWLTYSKEKTWTRPKIPTKSQIEVKGYFDHPKNGSTRKSFTATSFTLLACPHSQKKPYHCPIDCQCLKGKDLRAKVIREHNQPKFPYFKPQFSDLINKQGELEKVKHYD